MMDPSDSAAPDPPADSPSRPVIVGLGNPGQRYRGTRHNVGFQVLDELARRRHTPVNRALCQALMGGDDGLLLVAPQTYMNRSGFALRCLAERQEVELARMLVVYDEVRLPLGRLRARRSGSPGGHRGLESILENVGTDEVQRLRLGVGPASGEVQAEALVDFVLDPFTAAELVPLQAMIQRAADACELWASRGIDAAMQEFNG